ncbi:unnamed protein product [Cylindrotheca closterium]|uniref:Glycosyl transferase family WbsX n=1 Tax=Cylindrotheca closterium TaxID=2856 RepID=A0AAD2G9W9_9STRA|nr:unnamed protein product [Cylindrotheca closterium]
MDGFHNKAISQRYRRLRSRPETRQSKWISLNCFGIVLIAVMLADIYLVTQVNSNDAAVNRSLYSGDTETHNADIPDTTGAAISNNLKDFAHSYATTMGQSVGKKPEQTQAEISNFLLPRVLVLVFPQYHRDELNDKLWGEGFTDWDNLKKAPLQNRNGDHIPRPTELGYYDLTEKEPRQKQGALAKEYGIDGFVYHHYWFYDEEHPGPNLHQPLINMLADGHPDVPFALHWCAVKWMTTWSGQVSPNFVFKEPGVLQKQYFPIDPKDPKIEEHYKWLRQFFHHPNYIKVEGNKPLFMLYQKKPGAMVILKRLQELAMEDGFGGLMLTVGLTKNHDHLLPIQDKELVRKFKVEQDRVEKFQLYDKVVSYPNPSDWAANRTLEIPHWCRQNGHSNKRLKDIAGIISSFDNTPRRNFDEANLFATGDPSEVVSRFEKSLHSALYYETCCFEDKLLPTKHEDDDRFVLINAMNEWAEGMALEPSDVYGRKFLEAIRDTKKELSEKKCSLE